MAERRGTGSDEAALRRLRRTTGFAGLATTATFVAGNLLWAFDQPRSGASSEEILGFYSDNATNIAIGGTLGLLAIALFLFFASGLRSILREIEGDDLLGDVALAGGVLMAAAGLGAETINLAAALLAGDGDLSPELGRSLFEVSYVLGYNAAGVGIAALLAATAAASLRNGILIPRVLAWAAFPVAVAFCTPLAVFLLGPAVLIFGVASGMLLRASTG